MAPKTQSYPRKDGLFDADSIAYACDNHTKATFEAVVKRAIKQADEKSMRAMLDLSTPDADSQELQLRAAGKALFKLFKKYRNDPATAPAQFAGATAADVAQKLYDTQRDNLSRQNAGWRYQFLAVELARLSTKRFRSVSGGAGDSDLSAVAPLKDGSDLHLYVSVKNRGNTISGSLRTAAINKLEKIAISDRNKTGPYLCVFGIAMEKGGRSAPSGYPNTEFWRSDFFWEFFSGYTYKNVMLEVGRVLASEQIDIDKAAASNLPRQALDEFLRLCDRQGLLNGNKLVDAARLIDVFL